MSYPLGQTVCDLLMSITRGRQDVGTDNKPDIAFFDCGAAANFDLDVNIWHTHGPGAHMCYHNQLSQMG